MNELNECVLMRFVLVFLFALRSIKNCGGGEDNNNNNKKQLEKHACRMCGHRLVERHSNVQRTKRYMYSCKDNIEWNVLGLHRLHVKDLKRKKKKNNVRNGNFSPLHL